ncbi:nucleotidyltransferase-like protein [Salsuginibacillus kocurii]|uniref:nucleotidyltransferase-like protein n=1 Tax=Salsuginibacillus kocurii TaxID=427078 RepID=UPI00035D7316|nr:nucleotidyltransferase-like protein [Salsuginibacillus kocurii]
MKERLRHLFQERASHPETVGVLCVEKQSPQESFTDFFDVVLIIVTSNEQLEMTKHYICDDLYVAMHVVTEFEIETWFLYGTNRKMIDWIYHGVILFERNEQLTEIKGRIDDFSSDDRKLKGIMEFGKLLRRFEDGKGLHYLGKQLDAFNFLLHALHHLARLSIVEHGFNPEVTVWKQVKEVEPEIFKLYEELTESEENIEQKLELLMIGIEFSLRSKIQFGASHLIEIMNEQPVSWSYQELMEVKEVAPYTVDLELMLAYLSKLEIIKKEHVLSKTPGIFHIKYKVAKFF